MLHVAIYLILWVICSGEEANYLNFASGANVPGTSTGGTLPPTAVSDGGSSLENKDWETATRERDRGPVQGQNVAL